MLPAGNAVGGWQESRRLDDMASARAEDGAGGIMNGSRPNLCVFCGSSSAVADVYRQSATRLGTVLGRSGIDLTFGGGRAGLMGLVADAALAAGSHVTGIIPSFLRQSEMDHTGIHELLVTRSMHERKQLMYDNANAFVSLPGGFGTYDETFEVITWTQLGLSTKPVILVNVNGYWNILLDMIRQGIKQQFIAARFEGILTVVEQPEDVPGVIAAAGNGPGSPYGAG